MEEDEKIKKEIEENQNINNVNDNNDNINKLNLEEKEKEIDQGDITPESNNSSYTESQEEEEEKAEAEQAKENEMENGSENKNKFTVEELHDHFSLFDSQEKEISQKENLDSDPNREREREIVIESEKEKETEREINSNTSSDTNKKEIFINPDDYVQLMKIGEGNFSEIYLVENKESKLLYALKQFVKRRVEQLKKQEEVLMEKYVMSKISPHKYIIGYGGSYKDNVSKYIKNLNNKL
jgi:hypothetical protein